MLKLFAIAAAVALAGLLIFVATRPATFHVQRTARINAAPDKIFPHINDFHRWAAWSPFEKDPKMTKVFSGPTDGTGAVYEWDGNKDVGQGRVEITQSSPPSTVIVQLDFLRPFEAHNVAEFTLAPVGASTDVTWSLHGPNHVHVEGHEPLHEHGPDDRRRVRHRPGQLEAHHRELSRRSFRLVSQIAARCRSSRPAID